MDMNHYVLEMLVRDRLAEMRAQGERTSRIRAASPGSRPLRFVLGQALIEIGQRLQDVAQSSPMTIEPASGRSTHGALRG